MKSTAMAPNRNEGQKGLTEDEVPPNIQLEIIDLSPEALACADRREKARQQIIDSFSTLGFCQVSGMRDYSADELLQGSKWFFDDVSEQTKLDQIGTKAYNSNNTNHYRGYFPAQHDRMSCKEGYDVGLQWEIPDHLKGIPLVEKTPMLRIPGREKEVDHYYETLFRHRDIVRGVGDTIMSLIAEAGGEKNDYFKRMFSEYAQHTIRPIRYPQRVGDVPKEAVLPSGRVISTPAHADSGFLTLLQTFNYPGLELLVDDKWYAVPPNPETLIVNVGEQLSEMSNGRFAATVHRVMDIGKSRFSMPFFYEPGADADINTKIPASLLPPGTEDKFDRSYYPYVTFLFFKLPIYAEYSHVSDNIPESVYKKYIENYEPKECWATKTAIQVDGATFMQRKLKAKYQETYAKS